MITIPVGFNARDCRGSSKGAVPKRKRRNGARLARNPAKPDPRFARGAPKTSTAGAVTYRWTVQYIMDKEDKEAAELAGEDVKYAEDEVGSGRELTLTMNSSKQFKEYHSYILRLYVTDSDRNEYRDEAYLTITYVAPY